MLSVRGVLLVGLIVPYMLAFPSRNIRGNGNFQTMRHSSSHSSAPTDDTRTSRGIEEKQVNHKPESSPAAHPQPTTHDFKEILGDNERFNRQPGSSSSIRNEIDGKTTPHFQLSAKPKEVVTRKESQIVDSYQKEMEAVVKDISNGSTLQNSMIPPKKLQLHNLDDYYVQEDVGVEDGRPTATLTPNVQSLLRKNKEPPHLDAIPDYSHLEFPADTKEMQNGIFGTKSKHRHGPILSIKNPKDSVVKLGSQNHTLSPTTKTPFVSKLTVNSETKILVNDYVVPVPLEHLSRHGTKDIIEDNINESIGTNKSNQTSSPDIRYQKSKDEVKTTTSPIQIEKSTSISNTLDPNTFGNQHTANESQKSNKEAKTISYGSDIILDYPMDYLAVDDEEYKEKRLSNIENIVKLMEQPNVSSIQITSTDTIKVETGPVSTSNGMEASDGNGNTPREPLPATVPDESLSTGQDPSRLVINLAQLDTELKVRGDNFKTANFIGENSNEAESSSSSEETGNINGVPISRIQQTIAGEPVNGNNYTNTEATKIDIYLEIRAPSIVQPKSSSSNLEQQGQVFSVPLQENHHYHHEHNHNMPMANDNKKRSSLP